MRTLSSKRDRLHVYLLIQVPGYDGALGDLAGCFASLGCDYGLP